MISAVAATERLLSIVQFAAVSPFLMQTPGHSPRKEIKALQYSWSPVAARIKSSPPKPKVHV